MGLKTKTTFQGKITNKLALDNEPEWQKLFLMATSYDVNARIKFVRNQISQKTLVTNQKVYLFNIIESEICDTCTDKETITKTHSI